MFQWLKKKRQEHDQGNNTNKISSFDLIKKRFINQIQTLSGVTQNDFQSLYVTSINNFEYYLAAQNQIKNTDIFNSVLTDVVFALKKRQGYLLPVGADSETSFREREEWTFAVFLGALFKQIDKDSRFNIAKSIIPAQGFSWLHRNKKLFELWQAYLNDTKNIFSEIIGVDKFVQPHENNEVVLDKVSTTLDIISEKQASHLDPTTKNLIEKKIELPVFGDRDFWQWLKNMLEEQALSTNQADSVVHGVELGLLLVIPAIIDKFYFYQLKKLGLNDQEVNLSQRIQLTKAIKKHESLMRTEKGSRIHFYCLNKWEDRTVISGIVIRPQDFLSNHSIHFSVNSLLSVDPLASV